MRKEPILTKNFSLLFLFSVLICIVMNMLNVIIPLFATEDLRQTTAVAGVVTAAYTLAACVFRPINGVLADRLGRRRLMISGALLFCAGCFAAGAVPSVIVLGVCRVLMGVGYSAAATATNSASTDVIPASRLAEGVGYFGISQSIASAAGPALASVSIVFIGNRQALLLDGAIIISAVIVAAVIRYEAAPAYRRPEPVKRERSKFFEPTAVLPSFYQGLSLLLISCLIFFMPLYIVSRGLSASIAGGFFTVAAVMIITVRLSCSGLMRRVGAAAFLIPGYFFLIVNCFILPMADSVPMFLLCGVLHGLTHGAVWMALGSEAVRFAKPERRGAAGATFYFFFDASIGVGATIWGSMIDWLGYFRCFRVIAIGALALALCSIPVFRRRSARSQCPDAE